MVSHDASPRATSASLGRHIPRLVLVLVGLVLAAPPVHPHAGQWTDTARDMRSDPGNYAQYAIHLTLLPGAGSFHSRVLWWGREFNNQLWGGEWGWRPGSEGCAQFPDTSYLVPRPAPVSGVDIFCAGHAGLQDGRMLVPGGTLPLSSSYGENRARVFTPSMGDTSGTWRDPGEMAEWRWYPSATTLRDGRVLVASGVRYPHHRVFGGRRDGSAPSSPTGDFLQRFAPVIGGLWEQEVRPDSDIVTGQRPSPRQGHSFIEMTGVSNFGAQVLFGGRPDDGASPNNETWFLTRLPERTGSDYKYQWGQKSPAGAGNVTPRSDHSAIVADTSMIVLGGLDAGNSPWPSDVFRLHWDPTPTPVAGLEWHQLSPSGNPPPSARFGHAALFDTSTIFNAGTPTSVKRMIVFGGTSGPSAVPTDDVIYELRSPNGSGPEWRTITVVDSGTMNRRPQPRSRHAMVLDPLLRNSPIVGKKGHAALMFGGKYRCGTTCTSYSDTLWVLWLLQDGNAHWQMKVGGGPLPRARHTMTYDVSQGGGDPKGRLYMFGGEDGSGVLDDKRVRFIDPWTGGPVWDSTLAQLNFIVTRHTAVMELQATLSWVHDIYDPTAAPGSQWQARSVSDDSPLLWRDAYPLNFVVPGTTVKPGGGRLLTVGQDADARYLDLAPQATAAGTWLTHAGLDCGFFPHAAVMYRPGKILIAGGALPSGGVTGLTKTLDANNISNSWQPSASMAARDFHNLVLLPNGTVLAVGGMQTNDAGAMSPAVKQPQIWDTTGTWTTLGALDEQPRMRNYHSTAILLPDGRVFSAGGEGEQNDKYFGEIFCPPYLFKNLQGFQLAPRPVITTAPASLSWGKVFTICVPDTTGITRVCLIRPGATTHADDQNQRDVPLSFPKAGNPLRLLVSGPDSADIAPPGYYMLFLTGSKQAGTAYPDVPSIAKWLRIGPSGLDTCDTVKPGKITTLAPEVVSQDRIEFLWTATGDDAEIVGSGPSQEYDFRYYIGPINSPSAWDNAWPISGEPTPALAGTVQGHAVENLACCTWYHFAIRSRDDNANPLSDIHDEVKVKTLCIGCSGLTSGSGRDTEVTRLASAGPEVNGSAPGPHVASGSTTAGLVVETQRTSSGGWQVVVRRDADVPGLDAASSGTIVLQDRNALDGWSTRRTLAPQAGPIGLCALREEGRTVLYGDYSMDQLAPTLGGRPSNHLLAQASHSRTGSLEVSQLLNAVPPSLAEGEALTLTYLPSAAAPEPSESWYVLVRYTGAGGLGRPSPVTEAIPARFALLQNQPNPFDGTTSIRFELPVAARVKLEVFDASGRRVATLSDQEYQAGYRAIQWDRRGSRGDLVRSGVFLYRLVATGPGRETLFQDQKRMVLLPN